MITEKRFAAADSQLYCCRREYRSNSTYELGRQPFGLVSPAAWLRKRGHKVACLDLSRQSLEEAAVHRRGIDRYLLADAYGDASRRKPHSHFARMESARTSLLLWPVCTDERGLPARARRRGHSRR